MTREEAIQVLNMVEAHGLAAEAKRIAIESLSAESKWIPVSERLPNIGEDVLFCDRNWTEEGCLRADGDWFQFRWQSVRGKEEITAWMPLPKPYKGGDTE